MMKLNLGCGLDKKHGYINIDIKKTVKPDVICDARSMPFEDNTFFRVLCYNILEHVHDLPSVMKEIHRICMDGSIIIVDAPYYRSHGAFNDPTHVRYFTENTFDFWDIKTETGKKYAHQVNAEKMPFRVLRVKKSRSLRKIWEIYGIKFKLQVIKK